MLKYLLFVATLMVMSMSGFDRVFAQDTVMPMEPEWSGNTCCTVIGQLGNHYEPFCGSHPNADSACNCAKARCEDAGYTYIKERERVSNCTDFDCLACPIGDALSKRVASPRCKVTLSCCGCDGQVFTMSGYGRTWSAAVNDALLSARDIANTLHGGLRSWCVCRAPTAKPCPPATVRCRLFRR